MNRLARILTLSLIVSATTFADPIDDFLKDVATIAIGESEAKAVESIDKRLAAGDLPPDAVARISIRKAKFIAKERPKAGKLILDNVLRVDGVRPETKLAAIDAALGIFSKSTGSSPGVKQLREIKDVVLALPEFQAKGVNRGRMLQFVGATYAQRNFCDLACHAYREAADNFADAPERRVKALFRTAELALNYRDVATAEKALDDIVAMPDLPPATVQKAKLRKGLAIIGPSGYDWHPAPERVAKARALIEEALAPVGHQYLIPNDEAFRAKARLVHALHCSGNSADAAKIGEETLANAAQSKAAGKLPCGNLHILVGDILAEIGDYKLAIRHYEQAMGSSLTTPPKTLHKRIATLARKHKDYQRAMQAYADAAALCDRVEGKDEMKLLKGLAGLMSKAIRNKTSLSESDDVFGKTDDNVNNLNLDEL